ncbi:MAG: hypothetical protein COA58_03355 [Bacteroidetes bacterium]|nr:MAG: hypothetical protein COA58_03355 [Bacteroidota bacterium]
MSISLVTATFTGIDPRMDLKPNDLCHIRVFSDAQFPIIVELKGQSKRYPYNSIATFLSSWKNISKVAEMGS